MCSTSLYATPSLPTDPAVVIVSSGEESPRLVDTDSQPQLHAAVGASDQPSPPQDICQLWHLSSYFEMEDTEKFYVQCLRDHIPPVVQEGEGRPSLAEVEGLEKAWQAEQAYAGSVEGGGAELSGRGLERKDTGVQTDREQDRNSAEVRWENTHCPLRYNSHPSLPTTSCCTYIHCSVWMPMAHSCSTHTGENF